VLDQAILSREEFLWLAAQVASRAGIAFDARLFGAAHPPPHTPAQFRCALMSLGLTVARGAKSQPGGESVGWIGWRTHVLSGEEPGTNTHTDSAGLADALTVVFIARDADGTTRMHAPRPSEALAKASRGEGKLDVIETWVVSRPVHAATTAEAPDEVPGDNPSAASTGPRTASQSRFGFRTIWQEVSRHRSIWRDILLASLAIQLVGLGTPLLTQVIIDKVLVHQTLSTLTVVAVALLVFLAFSTTMGWIRQYLVVHTGNRVDAVLGDHVFGHLLKLPARWFEHRPTGTVIARLHGVETIREFLTGAAITLVLDLPFLCIFLAIMFFYSWELSLLALGISLLIAGFSAAVTPALRRRLDAQFLAGARTQAFTTEYVAGFDTVKALQLEPVLQRRYGGLLADYLRTTFATRQLGNTFNTIAGALEQLMTLGILVVGALIVMRNEGFTIGMLVAFQMFASRMSQPMMRIVGLWQELQQASIAVKRLGDLMNAPAEPYTAIPSRGPRSAAATVEIDTVGFRYDRNKPWVLRQFSLTLKPGEITVLTGASGSGKSTLTRLLLGYHRPEEGVIRIDGRDIAFLAANELRSDFGVVPQETLLFSGTVLDNLRLAKPDARFEEIVAACRKAEIHDTIERLPEAYNTPLGEHGVGLSGGQRQRIAIARALLRQPRVLIFDEATSALDATTAEHLAQTINGLRGTSTILFIAHHVPKGLESNNLVDVSHALRPPGREAIHA